ncbi:MAG TPA: chorismate mutase [Actinomycetota bacterium]|jgi:chorismate mutase|nr:chorismate mutase [Actinomycetota bacterium]
MMGEDRVEGERVRAVRGAICVERDTPKAILDATERLLSQMLRRNDVEEADVVSIFFTATEGLRSTFPAEAARRMGLGRVPLLCATEIPVPGSLPRVVRVLMHLYTSRSRAGILHVYLDGAESLRDDLD